MDPLGVLTTAFDICQQIADTIDAHASNKVELHNLHASILKLGPTLEALRRKADRLMKTKAARNPLDDLELELEKVRILVEKYCAPGAGYFTRAIRFLTARGIQGDLEKAEGKLNAAVGSLLQIAHLEVAFEHVSLHVNAIDQWAQAAEEQKQQLQKIMAEQADAAARLDRICQLIERGDGTLRKVARAEDSWRGEFEVSISAVDLKMAHSEALSNKHLAGVLHLLEHADTNAAQAANLASCEICRDPHALTDPVFVDSAEVGERLYCFDCITRWLWTSSDKGRMPPRINHTSLTGNSCRLRRVHGDWLSHATYRQGYTQRVKQYEFRWQAPAVATAAIPAVAAGAGGYPVPPAVRVPSGGGQLPQTTYANQYVVQAPPGYPAAVAVPTKAADYGNPKQEDLERGRGADDAHLHFGGAASPHPPRTPGSSRTPPPPPPLRTARAPLQVKSRSGGGRNWLLCAIATAVIVVLALIGVGVGLGVHFASKSKSSSNSGY